MGQVLVLDGGVVTGPMGSRGASVLVVNLDAGVPCPTGGVRVSLEDGGNPAVICNGTPGAQGAMGLQGAQGPQGVAGGVGPQGPVGATGATGPAGAVGPAGSQGVPGAQGPAGVAGVAGPAGPAGATGAQGLTGPQGPSGPALLLDGGALPSPSSQGFSFAGYTANLYDGNLGGITGAHAKCDLEFSGAHLCTYREFMWSAPPTSPSAVGAWLDNDAYSSSSNPNLWPRDRSSSACTNWTSNSNPSTNYSAYSFMQPTGYWSPSAYDVCQVARQLACCRSNTRWFRGYTSAKYDGNLGGILGAHAKCNAEFTRSHLCTYRELMWSGSGLAPAATGAWLDNDAYSSSSNPNLWPRDRSSSACTNWTSNSNPSTNYSAYSYLLPTGYWSPSAYDVCQVPRQLACCGD
jgi:hypothetical protein